MKLNKRECRKYALPDHAPDPNRGIFYVKTVDHIVCSAVRLIGGHQTLVLYVYERESVLAGSLNPVWTMFQNRDDYLTLERKDNGKTVWRTSTFELLGESYYFSDHCSFYTAQDNQRMVRFLNAVDTHAHCHHLSHLRMVFQSLIYLHRALISSLQISRHKSARRKFSPMRRP